MRTTVVGILTMRWRRQLCQARAPTARMPASTLTCRTFGTAIKALGHYLVVDCINLATITILQDGQDSNLPLPELRRELPTGCFSSTGMKELQLPPDFYVLGAHACDNCKLLTRVNISDTSVAEIREFTFVHCIRLQDVRLPYTVPTIHVKAFMNCAALQELAIPPSLHYMASRAFLDCTVLRRIMKMPAQRFTWRGTYAEENAFALCPVMGWPQWLHMIPDLGCVTDLA